MSKRKSFIGFIVTCCLILSSLFVFTACGKETPHEHKFSSKWDYDATYHWHSAECDDTDLQKDKELHATPSWASNATQHWKNCQICGYEMTERTNHNFVNLMCECGAVSSEAVLSVQSPSGEINYKGEFSKSIFEGLESDSIVTLLKNVTYEGTDYIPLNKSVVIDFNGHKITTTQSGGFDIQEDKNVSGTVNVVLKNGTLDTYKWGIWVENGGHLTVTSDFTILANRALATDYAGIAIVHQDSQLDFFGTLRVQGKTNAISGNGKLGYGGVVINIGKEEGALNGAVIEGGDNGVYMPNSGVLNIGEATITSNTALFLRSGTTTINGARLNAIGEKADYYFQSNKQDSTGDAILMDSVGSAYPGGAPSITLISATITSAHGAAFVVYKVNGNDVGNITNGTTDYQADVRNYTTE